MRNRLRFLAASLLVALLLGAASWLAAAARQGEPEPDSLYKHLSVFTEILGLVRQAYVEETDVALLMEGAYEGTADALDPFSIYVPADEAEAFRRLNGRPLEDSGLLLVRDRGWIYAAGVVPGSPAATAGVERGDLVAQVDGEPTRELDVWQIEALVAEKSPAPVKLALLRRGEAQEATLTPATFQPRGVRMETVRGVPVLTIESFGPGTAEVVAEALGGVADDRLVVDLRGTAGGDPTAAYEVADLFVDAELGSLRSKQQIRERFADSRPAAWRGDLVVLVDGGTLGAAEVLAAVLSEGAQAELVGEPTFGHAGRSSLIELSTGALLRITDAFYSGPSGEGIDDPLQPDLRVRERSRRLSERDLTLDQLILERGIDLLLERGERPAKVAA
ncbi:MAG TPA: S41 family peptidase [Thermoanaerobaculia bacterium]|nr:S41 family peptidase [Thermoanaerobaculia bacterium]